MPEAVLVAAARSPIGRARKGSLVDLRADDLLALMVRAALDQVPELDASELEDLVVGCGVPGGEQGFNLARVVAVSLGLDGLPGTTLTRFCASSLQALRTVFHAVRAGEGAAYLVGGVEVVSRLDRGSPDALPELHNPRFADAETRSGLTPADWHDPRVDGDLPDPYVAMGVTAENVARLRGVSRADMDAFAVRSHRLACEAVDSGFWATDITPVTTPDGVTVTADDGPRRGVTLEQVAALRPVFRPDGLVTAATACPLNDGAAALVVMSDVRAAELGITPLARVVSTAVTALSPEIMGLGPVEASRRALTRAGMTAGDLDLVEINEAFAAQVLPCVEDLGLDPERVNVHGGALAVGHPYGMTGARLASTLVHGLQWRDGEVGLETMCVGGGQGMAMVLERLR